MNNFDYRSRIYQRYVNARKQSLAPRTNEGFQPRGPLFHKIIRNYFPLNKKAAILDLGCGHGAFIYYIKKSGYKEVIGFDRSSEQVKEAKRLGIKGIAQGDLMEALRGSSPDSKDVIICFDVIEHFAKDEIIPLVDEVFRVLKKDGIWIIHTPNGESPFGGRMFFWDFTHEMAFTRSSISQLLLTSGFRDLVCFEDTPVPHGLKSAIRWALWKCIRGLLRFYIAVETGTFEKECIFTQNFLVVAFK